LPTLNTETCPQKDESELLRHVPLLPLDDVVRILAQQNRVEEKRAPVHQILEPAQSTGCHFLEEVGKKMFLVEDFA
jgi:hypothetical protein